MLRPSLVAGLALAMATSAHAAQLNFWLATDPVLSSFPTPVIKGSIVDPSSAVNDSYWRSDPFSVGTSSYQAVARGYTTANADGSGTFTQNEVRRYTGGLGICDGSSTNNVDACSSPNHSIDNGGSSTTTPQRGDNLIVFDFGALSASPLAFSIGWTNDANCSPSGAATSACPDIEAWVGDSFSAGPSGLTWSAIRASGSGWKQLLFPDNDIQVNTASNEHYYSLDTSPPSKGRYLIINPENIYHQGDTSNNDYFKLQSLMVEVPDPPSEVPVPGSLGLLALGSVFGLLFIRRLPLAA